MIISALKQQTPPLIYYTRDSLYLTRSAMQVSIKSRARVALNVETRRHLYHLEGQLIAVSLLSVK